MTYDLPLGMTEADLLRGVLRQVLTECDKPEAEPDSGHIGSGCSRKDAEQ